MGEATCVMIAPMGALKDLQPSPVSSMPATRQIPHGSRRVTDNQLRKPIGPWRIG